MKLKQIKNLMPENKNTKIGRNLKQKDEMNFFDADVEWPIEALWPSGYNSAIDQISEREIGMNREELIKLLMSQKCSYLITDIAKSEGTYLFDYDRCVQNLADIIINNEASIIEGTERK